MQININSKQANFILESIEKAILYDTTITEEQVEELLDLKAEVANQDW